VGENLQDHLELLLQYTCKEPVSLYSSMSPLAKLGIGLRCLPVSHFCSLLFVTLTTPVTFSSGAIFQKLGYIQHFEHNLKPGCSLQTPTNTYKHHIRREDWIYFRETLERWLLLHAPFSVWRGVTWRMGVGWQMAVEARWSGSNQPHGSDRYDSVGCWD